MTKNRKRNLRKINKVIRKANDAILKDELWNGRFYIQQERINFYTWDDNSGDYAVIDVRFLDLKTGRTALGHYYIIDVESFFSADLFMGLNNFIVDVCKVWNEAPVPSIYNKVIYRTDNSCPEYKVNENEMYCTNKGQFYIY